VDEACSTHKRGEKSGKLLPKEVDRSEDRGVHGRMGSECILRRLAGGGEVDPVGSG
jgi:hypothetical protein